MVKSRSKSSGESKGKPTKSKQIIKDKNQPVASPKRQSRNKKTASKQEITQAKQTIAHDYSMTNEGGVFKIKMHQNYQVQHDHKLYKDIAHFFQLFIQKQQKRCIKTHNVIPHSNFPVFQFKLRGEQPHQTKCSICQFQFEDKQNYQEQLKQQSDEDIIILSCSHLIHRSCFNMLKGKNQWIKCPVCSSIYGVMIGDQPPGNMTWSVHGSTHCDGFEDVGTIIIDYSMHSGKRGNISFPGTHRTAYLPDNKQGNEILKLLKQAFDRKLIFTIGRSVTTGRDNQVVWNGIHHKTHTSGGSAYFGYPDETYFKRVRLELAAKGIY